MNKNTENNESTKSNARIRPMMGGGHRLRGPVEKAKDFKGAWVKIIRYSKRYLPIIIVTLLISMGGTILQIIGPNKLKDLSNEIEKGLPMLTDSELIKTYVDMGAVSKIAWSLLFIYLASVVLNLTQGYIMATIMQKIARLMRRDIVKKINKLPFRYFDKTSYGDILSRTTNDVDAISQAMHQGVDTIISSITMLVGVLIMMIYNSWLLAIIAIVFSLLGMVLVKMIVKYSQKYFVIQQENLGQINGHIEEVFSNHHVVKSYGGFTGAQKVFNKINHRLYSSAWRSQFLSGMMMPVMHFIGNFGYVAVSIIGSILVIQGSISFGVIVAFMIYIRLFTQPLSSIAQAVGSLQQAAAAGERVFEFLEEEELSNEADKFKFKNNIKGEVEFKNVKFAYDPKKPVIHDFSASVKPGQKIAIVGPTGAGKTTIVNLLMRFYEIDSGEILLDNTSTSQVQRESVHEQFSMVLQSTWLFEGSIKDNIIFNKEGVNDEDVIQACKVVGLHNFIKTLPQRYETILDNQTTLSEGQKQLLTIARAMIQNAPLLILDEATSSVDTRTERIVQAAMDKLTTDRTSFVIAHRLSTIKNADLILVIKEGNIIESGNHEELLRLGGFYAELYNSQFEL